MTLFVCAKILGPDAHPQDPRIEPARHRARQIISELQTGWPIDRSRRRVRYSWIVCSSGSAARASSSSPR